MRDGVGLAVGENVPRDVQTLRKPNEREVVRVSPDTDETETQLVDIATPVSLGKYRESLLLRLALEEDGGTGKKQISARVHHPVPEFPDFVRSQRRQIQSRYRGLTAVAYEQTQIRQAGLTCEIR